MDSWKDNVRRVDPYVPGEQPKKSDIIKLNTNENPYPPSPLVRKALEGFEHATLRKYPDPSCTALTSELASYYGVNEDQIFVGIGSDDVLATAFLTFFCSDKPLLFPDISYSFYEVWAELFGISYEKTPLDDDFNIVPELFMRGCGGIVFPNPNAPTGIELPLCHIENIIKANRDCVVIVDEAYIDFGGESALPLTEKYDNLLVVRTFSKSRSLAGLRVGFAIGSSELISYLWSVRNSFNSYTLSALSCELAVASLRDEEYFVDKVKRIVATREKSKESFSRLGFEAGDSKGNFLFVRHPEIEAAELFQRLYNANIFVRYFNSPRTKDYLRVTIGTEDEMAALFDFLKTEC